MVADGTEREVRTRPRQVRDSVHEVLATVVFLDVVDSTRHVARLGDRAWLDLLGRLRELVRATLPHFGGREVKELGDGFLAVFDLPAQGIRWAITMRDAVPELGISLRAGVHVGEVEVEPHDVTGLTVHIGERICMRAKPGEVLVSRTVRDLVPAAGITFVDRGAHELRGVPGRWRCYAAELTR